MPAVSKTCSACSLRITRSHHHDVLRLHSGRCSVRSRKGTRRAASSAAATALKSKPVANDGEHRVLTILHKARSLIPHILPSKGHAQSETDSLEFWERVLGRTYDDLCPTPEARQADGVRIAVYGCDEYSGAHELVSALLEEPFASETQRKAVHSRWKTETSSNNSLTIEHMTSTEGSSVQLQSAWLLQFGAPVKVLEFNSFSLSSSVTASFEDLLTADIPVIVCNPASIPLHTVLSESSQMALPLTHPNAVLVLTSTCATDRLTERLRASFRHDLTILFADPTRALQGLRTISAAPSSPSAVQRYQDDFAGSNVPELTRTISQIIPQSVSPSTVIEAVRTETAQAVVQDALSACKSELSRASDEINHVCDGISSMRARMEELRVRAPKEVLVGEGVGNEVQHAVDQSRKDIKAVLDRLTWWKLLWKVDDVGDTVMDAVNRAWCRDLEYRLVFHAGRLALLQRSFVESATSFTASFKTSSAFHSPVLQNQISATPTFSMDAAAFLQPLYSRRQQLRYPTARLQTAGQRVLLGMSGSVFGGASVAWAGWAGQLGIIDVAMQTETVIGVGMLGAAAGIRWAVGRFERAKKMWLKDYDRVGEGLERDLRTTLAQTVNDRVLVVADKACDGMEHAAAKRKAEIEELEEEVEVLEDELGRTHQ